MEDDERLRPLISGFEKRHLGSDTSVAKSGDVVTIAQLSTVSLEEETPVYLVYVNASCSSKLKLNVNISLFIVCREIISFVHETCLRCCSKRTSFETLGKTAARIVF